MRFCLPGYVFFNVCMYLYIYWCVDNSNSILWLRYTIHIYSRYSYILFKHVCRCWVSNKLILISDYLVLPLNRGGEGLPAPVPTRNQSRRRMENASWPVPVLWLPRFPRDSYLALSGTTFFYICFTGDPGESLVCLRKQVYCPAPVAQHHVQCLAFIRTLL